MEKKNKMTYRRLDTLVYTKLHDAYNNAVFTNSTLVACRLVYDSSDNYVRKKLFPGRRGGISIDGKIPFKIGFNQLTNIKDVVERLELCKYATVGWRRLS